MIRDSFPARHTFLARPVTALISGTERRSSARDPACGWRGWARGAIAPSTCPGHASLRVVAMEMVLLGPSEAEFRLICRTLQCPQTLNKLYSEALGIICNEL